MYVDIDIRTNSDGNKVMETEIKNLEMAYRKWLQTDKSWQDKMEKDIRTASDGKIRAFHLLFNSPSEFLSGKFQPMALMEQDVINMYPSLYETVQNVKKGQFLYIFNCHSGIGSERFISSQVV